MGCGRGAIRHWRLSVASRNSKSCNRKSARTEKLHKQTEDGIQQIPGCTSAALALSAENAAGARRLAGKQSPTTSTSEARKRIANGLVQSTRRNLRFEPA